MIENTARNEYKPDFVSPPGETLREILEEKELSQAELARRMGRPIKTINEIVKGKAAITPETAIQLERALGVSATFWDNFERLYRADLARREEKKRLGEQLDWLDQFPIKFMIKQKWIQRAKDPVEQVEELLNFFGVASPEVWRDHYGELSVVYRKSPAFQSSPAAVSAWLRRGYLLTNEMECRPFNSAMIHKAIPQMRNLTQKREPSKFLPVLTDLCSSVGILVTLVPEVPGTSLSGATRWLTQEKAFIQLSARYKTDDHLWFTFFHELGHILLHGKRDFFVDVLRGSYSGSKEKQADKFAANTLIPPNEYQNLRSMGIYSEANIREFAGRIGIGPGIIVGRLQHEGILRWNSRLNVLKVRFKWA